LITAVGAGTAIVLVSYDAMLCHHTSNVVPTGTDLRANPAFFSALWAENTGVFVVAVDAPESGIKSNMNINENWNVTGASKEVSYNIDAEHDVLYYEAEKGSFPYTFTPEGVTKVLLATSVVGENVLSYSGFSTDSVTANKDGSYTVNVTFGRNIVKLVSATGAEYQVINAKPVTYTVINNTRPNDLFLPGDEFSIVFNTLYHPSNNTLLEVMGVSRAKLQRIITGNRNRSESIPKST
jgi:GR25 family glycosyltransferase involved in LPS biosynthesis